MVALSQELRFYVHGALGGDCMIEVQFREEVGFRRCTSLKRRFACSPNPTSVRAHHCLSRLAAECLLKLRHVLKNAVGTPASGRVRVDRHQKAAVFITAVLAPHSCESQKETLLRSKAIDRKSTRLNSSHVSISYAVF